MKEIKIIMSDRVYSEFRNNLMVKKLACNMYGTIDAILAKIADAMEKDEKELLLKFKNEE